MRTGAAFGRMTPVICALAVLVCGCQPACQLTSSLDCQAMCANAGGVRAYTALTGRCDCNGTGGCP
jgi:hypothetical protein